MFSFLYLLLFISTSFIGALLQGLLSHILKPEITGICCMLAIAYLISFSLYSIDKFPLLTCIRASKEMICVIFLSDCMIICF